MGWYGGDGDGAAAICEAMSRPSMRFLRFRTGLGALAGNPRMPVKTEAQQAAAGVHKLRALLIKQRSNATFRHLITVRSEPRSLSDARAAQPQVKGRARLRVRSYCLGTWRKSLRRRTSTNGLTGAGGAGKVGHRG